MPRTEHGRMIVAQLRFAALLAIIAFLLLGIYTR
jgi:hypothetical protein